MYLKYCTLFIIIFVISLGSGVLPDFKKTPGEIVPGTMLNWICNHYIDTPPLYRKDIILAFKNYGISINDNNYKVDQLIPIELGGTNNVKNLWPQNLKDFYLKNKVEKDMFRCLCNGLISLKEAQSILIKDWKSWKIDSLK